MHYSSYGCRYKVITWELDNMNLISSRDRLFSSTAPSLEPAQSLTLWVPEAFPTEGKSAEA